MTETQTDDGRAAAADADMREEAAKMTRMAGAISEFLRRAHPKRYLEMVLNMNPEYLVSKPVKDDGTGVIIKKMMQQGKLKLHVLPDDVNMAIPDSRVHCSEESKKARIAVDYVKTRQEIMDKIVNIKTEDEAADALHRLDWLFSKISNYYRA